MANVHELPIQPDESVMADVLHAVFANSLHGRVEIAWLTGAGGVGARQFDLTELDEAAAYAAHANARAGCNVYFSAGLRSYAIEENARGEKDQVIAVAALKLDCDDPGCLTRTINLACDVGFPPNIALYTGREPHLRGSVWWLLTEPDSDKARAERLEQRLIALSGADKVTWNADRIMRLAGSVAWPTKKGRVLEMSGRYETVTRKAPYTLDEIEHTLDRLASAAPKLEARIVELDLNQAKRTIDVAALLEAAREPEKFHENALPAIMSLIDKRVPPEPLVELLTGAIAMSGVNVQQRIREMTNMVRGAVKRVAREDAAKASPYEPADRDPFPLLALAEIGLQGPPEWRIDKLLPKVGFGVIYGASGTFKSFVTLDMALTVATGLAWRGQRVEAAPAAYVAGEGTYGIQNRVVVWREHRYKGDAPFYLAPVASNFLDPANVRLVAERLKALEIKFVVVDTLARSFGGGDENSSQDMGRFIAACDFIRDECGTFVLAVHHTGKDEQKGERGSNALRGAADVRLNVSRGIGDMSAIIHVQKQKDSEDGQRYRIRLVQAETAHPVTGEIVTSLMPVWDEKTILNEPVRTGKNERLVLAVIDDGPHKFGTIRARTGLDSGTLGRTLRTLFEKNLVAQENELWILASGVSDNE